ncbi:MAG TPA: GNAT family N-acetyltransferase [Candidatus Bathyarchaeia archaeon]|nr:GNAT family N-acetyltransferase [Candidatus Bathyarchaeia archaeon]
MSNNDFTFQHLETPEDIEENLEIMRKVFGQNEGVDLLVKKFIYNHPKMTLKNHFIIKHNGRMVATLNLIPLNLNIGDIPLKVAEMGCVATLEEYRNRGLMRRLVNEYHKAIAEQDYDLSVIEGIPFFYRQFGYEYALPLNEETRIPLEKLPDCRSKLVIRPFIDKDIPEAMKLLAKAQDKFYVHGVRDEQIWKMQQETRMASERFFEAYTVENADEMVAYFRISRKPENKELLFIETTDTDYPATDAILSFIKSIGGKGKFETLVARTSYYDPLTRILVTLGAEQRVPPYAWQIRVTDYVSLLQKMRLLFEKRLAKSEYCGLTEEVNFNFCRYIIQMAFENGAIIKVQRLRTAEKCTVGVNPLVFVKLLLGYRCREELEMNYPDFYVHAKHKRLMDVLFPQLPSYIHSVQ